MRKRGELIERSFAHLYNTGGMRRVHLRRKDNIAKRALLHAAAFNLSLILRQMLGVGTARQAEDRIATLCFAMLWLTQAAKTDQALHRPFGPITQTVREQNRCRGSHRQIAALSTGCQAVLIPEVSLMPSSRPDAEPF